ncbi:MAG: hypothetical protein Q7K65_00170 [Candidatus Buchananbacteria bacterium]|nr:hypothetical protein [Candidatus Buchananbacteria bacterium]
MLLTYKIIKPILIILIVALVGLVGLFGYGFRPVESQGITFSFAGWLWSDNYGWISLNSNNCLLLNPGECLSSGVDYSVKIDSGNNISGYGWSENVGWVCFGNGRGDSSVGCLGAPPTGGLDTTMDSLTGKITGWAKVLSLDGDGWMKLGRGSYQGASFGEACYDCQPKCTQWTIVMQGTPPVPVEVPPCLAYSDTEFDSCNTCFTKTNFDGVNIPNPNEESVVNGSGNICTSCSDCHKISGAVSGTSRIVCNTDGGYNGKCTSCELYGVNKNLGDGQLVGWSWNGTGDGLNGAGWVHFNSEFGSGYTVFPWLQTLYGSIYTPKWVRQKAGSSGNNATYCILAEDINANIKSQNCEDIASGLVQGVDTGFLEKSPSGGIYRNALGKIDMAGMINKVASGGTRNKYGQIVNDLSQSSWTGPSGDVLKGEVYHFKDNLQITSQLQFVNGSANVPGNGIIIVDGNLKIESNISYSSSIPSKLNELASVVWIVKGDVIIDPSVTDVVGVFVVLGDGVTACQLSASSSPDYHKYQQNGCGVFFSGDSDKSFTVLGLVIAKAFDFGRTFAEILQGSERVIYDGRLTANPPKALSGFVEGLPVIRDFAY